MHLSKSWVVSLRLVFGSWVLHSPAAQSQLFWHPRLELKVRSRPGGATSRTTISRCALFLSKRRAFFACLRQPLYWHRKKIQIHRAPNGASIRVLLLNRVFFGYFIRKKHNLYHHFWRGKTWFLEFPHAAAHHVFCWFLRAQCVLFFSFFVRHIVLFSVFLRLPYRVFFLRFFLHQIVFFLRFFVRHIVFFFCSSSCAKSCPKWCYCYRPWARHKIC